MSFLALGAALLGGYLDKQAIDESRELNLDARDRAFDLQRGALNETQPLFESELASLRRAVGLADRGYDDAQRLAGGAFAGNQIQINRQLQQGLARGGSLATARGLSGSSVGVNLQRTAALDAGFLQTQLADRQARLFSGIEAGRGNALALGERAIGGAYANRSNSFFQVANNQAQILGNYDFQPQTGNAQTFGQLAALYEAA